MEFFGIGGVAAISLVCYLAAELIKALGTDKRWLPVICGALGGALGVMAMFFVPEFPAGDWINALAVGIASGLAATGADQAVKQLGKKED